MSLELPYFDDIFERLERSPDSPLSPALHRHVHWGLFSSPETTDLSLPAYVTAAEAMTDRLRTPGRVVDDEKIDAMGEWTDDNTSAQSNFYGVKSAAICSSTYTRLARVYGFTALANEDVTAATMPNYPFLEGMFRDAGLPEGRKATAYL